MAKVSWSAEARKDLRSIAEYIEKDSIRYAGITITKLTKAVERLIQFPKSGRIVPELQMENIREVIEGNYRIVYLLKDNICFIVSVIHSKQDLMKHFAKKLSYDA